MIRISIKESPDTDLAPQIEFFQNIVMIGSSHNSHLYIEDPNILNNHVKMILDQKGLWIETINTPFFEKNKIKVSGKTLVKKNDNITLGSTQIKIDDYELEKLENPLPSLDEIKDEDRKKMLNEIKNLISINA